MTLFKYLILFLVFCSASLFAISESDFSAHVSISPEEITLDQHVTVTLKLSYPSSYHPDYQKLEENLLHKGDVEDQPFALINQNVSKATGTDTLTETITYTLEPWHEGRIPISFRNIHFSPKNTNGHAKDEKQIDIWAELLSVNILPTNSKSKSDILEPKLLPPPGNVTIGIDAATRHLLKNVNDSNKELSRNIDVLSRHSFPWITILCIAGLLGLGWITRKKWKLLFRRLRNRLFPVLTPHEKARRNLKLLTQEELPNKGLFEEYYVKLTNIVRVYIEEQFHLHATEQTTEEFLHEASSHHSFDEEMRQQLSEFLGYADLVKFARYSASKEDCDHALQAAERLTSS
jgi:hypothetical protein